MTFQLPGLTLSIKGTITLVHMSNIISVGLRPAALAELLCLTFAQLRTQDFSMGGISVTSHRDDVKISRKNSTSLRCDVTGSVNLDF